MNRSTRALQLAALAIAALLYLPGLGAAPLFDWDEANFAEAAREMLVTGDWLRVQIGYEPFAEKPPLYIWLQAISMGLLGVDEFAARLPNALAGAATAVLLIALGARLHTPRFGALWALCHAGAALPGFYFRFAIIDPVFNLLMFGAVAALYSAARTPARSVGAGAVAGLCAGLAVLAKGPVGIALPVLCAAGVGLWCRRVPLRLGGAAAFGAAALVVAAPWYVFQALDGGALLSEFARIHLGLAARSQMTHGGPFYFHVLALLIGCFPSSVFALALATDRVALRNELGRAADGREPFGLWMAVLLVVVVVVFGLVSTKILHYSSLAYFAVSYLAARALARVECGELAWRTWMSVVCTAVAGAAAALLASMSLLSANAERWIVARLQDPVAAASFSADVDWAGVPWVGAAYGAVVVGFVVFVQRRRAPLASGVLLAGTAVTVALSAALGMPRIAEHVQGAAVEYYRSMRGRDVHLRPLAFRSYAYLFYAETAPPPPGEVRPSLAELLTGRLDRPAYFVAQLDHRDELLAEHPLEVVDERDAYVLLERR